MASYKYSAEDLMVRAREAQRALDSIVAFNLPKLLTGHGIDQPKKIAGKLSTAMEAVESLRYMLAHNARVEEHEQQGDAATPLQLPY